MAARVAIWRRGYSRAQIEAALGYSSGDAPKALWRRAADYADFLEEVAGGGDQIALQAEYQQGDLDGPGLVAMLEELYAASVDPSIPSPIRIDTGAPVVDPSAPDAADQARRLVRRRWRTPRVVTLAEWDRAKFGLPEPFSEALLYRELDRRRVAQADQELRAQPP